MSSFGWLQPRQPLPGWVCKVGIASLVLVAGVVPAKEPPPPLPAVSISSLPPEARQVYRSIHAGGPFVSPRDGTVFFNRERLLAAKPRGYWREYTVLTPGVATRGARRIVCGGERPRAPEACFYTADHYSSFRRIAAEPAPINH